MTSCDACLAPDGQSKPTASSQGEPQGLLHEMHEVLEGAAPLPRETLLAQAITRSGASWPASRAPAGDESRRRSHHASALQIQVSSSALPHQIASSSPAIFSLPPDCTRAATVTVSERSEHLHVIAVLLTPRDHCFYPAAINSAIHHHHIQSHKKLHRWSVLAHEAPILFTAHHGHALS